MRAIYFDMDGTIADLYGVDGWLNYLQNEDVTPYEIAKPLQKEMTLLKHALSQLKDMGYVIGIISWSAKNGSKTYNAQVRSAKKRWINKFFPNIFSEFHVVKYGTNKKSVAKIKDSIIFDDDSNVRDSWDGIAYDVTNMVNILFGFIADYKSNHSDYQYQPPRNISCDNPNNGHYAYIDQIIFTNSKSITKVGKASNINDRKNKQKTHRYSDSPKIEDVIVHYYFTCKSDEDAIAMENVLRSVMTLLNPRAFKFNDRLLDWDESYVSKILNHPATIYWAKEFCI